MEEKSTTATIEELFGVSSPDDLRRKFHRAFARKHKALNGYEMIKFLKWLIEGCVACAFPGSEDIYCEKDDDTGQPRFCLVEKRGVEVLQRIGLIESRVLTAEAKHWLCTERYVPTPKGQRFFSNVPETYRGGEPYALTPGEDLQFWTVILRHGSQELPDVYPYIGTEAPDSRKILSEYETCLAEGCEARITGPHSLRLIPASAFALDEYPVLEGKVGPRIIRSWFDTVINPILADLKHKEGLLVLRNWTWRVPPGHLESVRPVEESPWQVSADNLEQLISFYPNVEDLIERHDEGVSELEDACKALHNALAVSRPAKDAYAKAKEDNSLIETQGTPINAVLPGPGEQDLDLIAQYIVNTAGELPHYHIYSPVWNKYKAEFLGSLEDPAVRPLRDASVQAGENLLRTVNELTALLKQIRSRLSLQLDVPFVTGQSAPEE